MGYDCESITIFGRLERHACDGDRRDDAAWERLQDEVEALIDSDPEYTRIAGAGLTRGARVDTVQPGLLNYRRNLIS